MQSEESKREAPQPSSDVEHKDWMDLSESEFVDYVEGRHTFGLVFEHDEIGFHGLKFDPRTGDLEAVVYDKVNDE